MIRVVIVEDHGVVRAGLAQLLATFEGVEVVGEAGGGAVAAGVVAAAEPDVVLMDLAMPEVDGIEATRRVLAVRPGTQVVVLTSFSDRERILRALDAGAVGYLLKDATPHELESGLRAAARGESPLDPRAARAIVEARRGREDVKALLSEREREVLVLVGRGLANKEIARRLEISEKTVKAHLTSVFRRIGSTDRTQAALWAERNGLLDGGGS